MDSSILILIAAVAFIIFVSRKGGG